MERGANSVIAVCSHGVLSGPAVERIQNSGLSRLIVTDTIQLSEAAVACEKIQSYTVSNLLGEAIRRVCDEESVSSLFV